MNSKQGIPDMVGTSLNFEGYEIENRYVKQHMKGEYEFFYNKWIIEDNYEGSPDALVNVPHHYKDMIINGNSHHSMNLYFESSAIIIYFVKLGRYIDGISKAKTKEAIQKLVEITPNQATIEINGVEKIVTLDEIKKENIIIAKPGEKIAVDGEIIERKSTFR